MTQAGDSQTSSWTDDPRAFAGALARDLSARGVRALLLRGPVRTGFLSSEPSEQSLGIELLVHPKDASRARAVLDRYDWNYELGGNGTRALPITTYSWAKTPYMWREAPMVELRWGVPAAPLPWPAFRELERALWNDASTHPLGFADPTAESLAVYLALQAARTRSRREEHLRYLHDLLAVTSWERCEQIAAHCKLRAALRWAVDAARRSTAGKGTGRNPVPPPTDRAALRLAWRAGALLGAYAYPRRLRPLITGTSGFGGGPTRCRFAGVEILVGPGAFAPELPSERLVTLALDLLSARLDAVVVEPGTGSGAISFALAAAHPGVEVHAIEKYAGAFQWARRNARRLGQTRVHVHHGSLLDPLPEVLAGRVALIVANLPYVPSAVWSGKGRFVREAVRGQGDDGLGLYRRLARQARRFLEPGGHLVLEMGPYQVDAFRSEVAQLGYCIESVEPEILGAVVLTVRLGDPSPRPEAPGDVSAAFHGG